jgi:hypothetical protein
MKGNAVPPPVYSYLSMKESAVPPPVYLLNLNCNKKSAKHCTLSYLRIFLYILQVLRGFGIPQRKHLYFISVSGAFLGTSLPPTHNFTLKERNGK